MWMLSGGLFPASRTGWTALVQRANPMAYSVSAVRRALYAGALPPGTGVAGAGALLELSVLCGFCLLSIAWAITLCYRRR
jgi:ABC-type polysaccharide/polyol phosphate export permease